MVLVRWATLSGGLHLCGHLVQFLHVTDKIWAEELLWLSWNGSRTRTWTQVSFLSSAVSLTSPFSTLNKITGSLRVYTFGHEIQRNFHQYKSTQMGPFFCRPPLPKPVILRVYPRPLGARPPYTLCMLSYIIKNPLRKSSFLTMASESRKCNHEFGWKSKDCIHL